jgi:ketosteroid isomerase-like protein
MDELKGDGIYAYMRATYDITLSPPGLASISDTGKTLIVFRKQPNGIWLRVADAWNSNLPGK